MHNPTSHRWKGGRMSGMNRLTTHLAIPLNVEGKATDVKHCEWIPFDRSCFNHKEYPTCECGLKYVPIEDRGMCPYCWHNDIIICNERRSTKEMLQLQKRYTEGAYLV